MSTSKPPVHDAPDISQHDRELFHRLRTLDDMIRASEETEDKLRRISERRRIPPVPDLRFEYSYTRSVSQYVHVDRVPPPSSEKGKEKATDGDEEQDSSAVAVGAGELVRVDWGRVIWITTRDQVISPLVQGALWCVTCSFSCCAALEHELQGSCKPFPAPARGPGGCAHSRLVGERVAQGRRAGRQRRAVAEELDGHHLDTDARYERFPPVNLVMLRLLNVQRIWTLGNTARLRLSATRQLSRSWPAILVRATPPTAYDPRAQVLPTRSPTCTATTRRRASGTTQVVTNAVSSRDARAGIPSSLRRQLQCSHPSVTQEPRATVATRVWKPCSRAATAVLRISRAEEPWSR